MDTLSVFVHKIRSLRHQNEMISALANILQLLGFEAFNYGCGRISLTRGPIVDRIFSTLDPQWISYYAEKGYFREDRLVAAALQRTAPFAYDEIFSQPTNNLRQIEMEERFGYRSGLVIPIHGPDTSFALLSAAAEGPKDQIRQFTAETIAKTQFAAVVFNQQVQSLPLPKTPPALDVPPPELSDRQLNCLTWCAAGKTNWEIGQMLGVSERTAKKHVESAMHKLAAKTRAQAVARALELGLIKP